MTDLYFPGLSALGPFDKMIGATPDDQHTTLLFKNGSKVILSNSAGGILDAIWPPATDNRAPVEDGWRLMPVEITEEMILAGVRVWLGKRAVNFSDEWRMRMLQTWRGFLAAAPTPPTGSRETGA